MKHSEGFLKLVNEAKTRVKETGVHEVKQWQDAGEDFYLVDTREDHEWARGRLPGALHLCRSIT
jgi:hypothetical protein